MDWNDLRFVLAIARGRTLVAAGRSLGVDHTTAGRRLVALEARLRTRLFDRTADGFTPTAAGDVMIAHATAMADHAIAVERELSGRDERVEGRVRLTAVDAFLDGFLVPRLPPFLARYPGIELDLVSDIRMFDLSRREADVGIRYRRPKDAELVGRRVGQQASALYASREYVATRGRPRRPAAGHALVSFPADLDETPEARSLRDAFPGARVAVRCSNAAHMLTSARAGVGIALLDCYVGDAHPELVRVVAEPPVRDELWVVCHVDLHRSARVRALSDFVAAAVRDGADALEGRARRS